MRSSLLTLPKSFLGFMPLYLAVEIVLGISILNKCSGAYGILALFTGHPLDFMQWIAYLWSVFTLIVFSQGLYLIHKPNLLVFSQICVLYTIDTISTCFFTLWFTTQWFTLEDTANIDGNNALQSNPISTGKLTERGIDISKQSATESYEYSMTILITLVSLIFRFYFNFILASFVQELLHHPKYLVDRDDVEQNLKNKPIWKRLWAKSQKGCYKLCKNLLE
ncbi:Inositol phosphorylceramide synthase regulatory subunit kei1 [Saccharomyces cerevisiae]|uniref:K7_Ydr367wp n=2 Tax=Saccharomyces TaxID=4930 RepID=G2WBA3_YEASK|nr:Kei1p [Saccharomyces cerevisiae YJM193]AJU59570.1 Kei1p [Saccharomyces cerevisiae YJM195]AJU70769.1 Kei1p [Saccharomyces cerevisiae YJM627]AJU73612.1 Kei1p [Saccharomyces cerevisiae YJM689]AJU83279.1 Kei1p [Saccharomyces cerevisiae YJM1190]AJU83990.1 Kei1p [Saccharomyces cerevisiae YJM1199]AJU84705.1 Kei1p [Saccharomyces cerevisiae YJM1202]AJU87446.1 Kei1p [Saccharomyces cerevisiae YJM1248]AJU90243.1 Kei1p [Saccharomyces cerevisiae YJM1304]AJU90960.1 Kei1p [Saccharomyces cerevisiae YJM1